MKSFMSGAIASSPLFKLSYWDPARRARFYSNRNRRALVFLFVLFMNKFLFFFLSRKIVMCSATISTLRKVFILFIKKNPTTKIFNA